MRVTFLLSGRVKQGKGWESVKGGERGLLARLKQSTDGEVSSQNGEASSIRLGSSYATYTALNICESMKHNDRLIQTRMQLLSNTHLFHFPLALHAFQHTVSA